MNEQKMENATSICKQITEYISSGHGKEKLELLASWLEKQEHIKVSFCRIFRKRWSHEAGKQDLYMPLYRINLNDKWGMLTGEIPVDEERWNQIIACITDVLSDNEFNAMS